MRVHGIFLKTIFDHLKSLVFWSVGLFLMVLMYMSFYPSLAENSELQGAFQELPEAFKQLVGSLNEFGTPAGYLQTEFFSITLPLLLSIAAISIGSGLVNKEETSGTIELLLARPVSRGGILCQKVWAMLVILAVMILALVVGFLAGIALIGGFDINFSYVLAALLATYVIAVLFGLLALAATALWASRALAIGLAALIYFGSYVISSFAQSVDFFEKIKVISVFHYYQTADMLKAGPMWSDFLLLAAVAAVLYAVAWFALCRRDLGV